MPKKEFDKLAPPSSRSTTPNARRQRDSAPAPGARDRSSSRNRPTWYGQCITHLTKKGSCNDKNCTYKHADEEKEYQKHKEAYLAWKKRKDENKRT
jgi:hypothetical protein